MQSLKFFSAKTRFLEIHQWDSVDRVDKYP